jgi:hypothetical protein
MRQALYIVLCRVVLEIAAKSDTNIFLKTEIALKIACRADSGIFSGFWC